MANYYEVRDRGRTSIWNLAGAPPGPPDRRPRAVLRMEPSAVEVRMGPEQLRNIELGVHAPGLFTKFLANCSAFCVLWKPTRALHWRRASLVHIPGGPDPMFGLESEAHAARYWHEMTAEMTPEMGDEGIFYGVLANTAATMLTDNFLIAVRANTQIPEGNLWVYNASPAGSMLGSINYGIDWNGFTGETP